MAWPWARSAFVVCIQLHFVFYTIFASLADLEVSISHVRISSDLGPGTVSAESAEAAEAVFH